MITIRNKKNKPKGGVSRASSQRIPFIQDLMKGFSQNGRVRANSKANILSDNAHRIIKARTSSLGMIAEGRIITGSYRVRSGELTNTRPTDTFNNITKIKDDGVIL